METIRDGLQAKVKTEENKFMPYGGQGERNIARMNFG